MTKNDKEVVELMEKWKDEIVALSKESFEAINKLSEFRNHLLLKETQLLEKEKEIEKKFWYLYKDDITKVALVTFTVLALSVATIILIHFIPEAKEIDLSTSGVKLLKK